MSHTVVIEYYSSTNSYVDTIANWGVNSGIQEQFPAPVDPDSNGTPLTKTLTVESGDVITAFSRITDGGTTPSVIIHFKLDGTVYNSGNYWAETAGKFSYAVMQVP